MRRDANENKRLAEVTKGGDQQESIVRLSRLGGVLELIARRSTRRRGGRRRFEELQQQFAGEARIAQLWRPDTRRPHAWGDGPALKRVTEGDHQRF